MVNVRGWIAKQKDLHQRSRTLAMRSEVSKLQLERAELERKRKAEAELLRARAEKERVARDVKNIQQAGVSPKKPSKLRAMGQGLKRTIDKGRSARAKFKATAVPSTGSKGIELGGSGSPFGGTRNIDVGGSGFNYGPSKSRPAPEKKKRTVVVINQ